MTTDIAPYIDRYGLVSGTGETTGNGIAYSSYWMVCLMLNKVTLDEATADHVESLHRAIQSCEVKHGLYKRSPDDHTQCDWDDYIALCAASASTYLDFGAAAHNVFLYGVENNWVFNDQRPDAFHWAAWFGRSPAFTSHVRACTGSLVELLDCVVWCLSVASTSFAPLKNQDRWVQAAMMIVGARDKNFMMRWASRLYFRALYRKSPGGLGKLFGDYFVNPNHPLAVHWPRDWREA